MSGEPLAATGTVVLVVARDADYRATLVDALTAQGFAVRSCAHRFDANRMLASFRPDVIVKDVQATGAFAPFRDRGDVPVIILANHPSESTLRHLRARAAEVLVKPVAPADLGAAIGDAVGPGTARRGKLLRPSADKRITARSPAMRQLLEQVQRLRDSDIPVLILGETGTGKTMLARAIHAIGARGAGPFVDLNCAGLTTELVESELFGHERGSFTGAHAAKQGLFDAADGGTLFLDEIGDIDVRVQPRILKVLEEKRFRRMGDVRERTVDVRLIAATNADLLGNVGSKTFRADLYYRISTVRLYVPPLRERPEDILPLAMEMLERMGETQVAITVDAEARLLEYHWPGNIRELKNVIESSTLLRQGADLTADDLRFDESQAGPFVPERPSSVRMITVDMGSQRLLGVDASDATRAEVEREHIRLALVAEHGRVEAAARRLGMPRSTLYWKLKRFGLTRHGEEARDRLASSDAGD